jgi:hypothetical protein
MTVHIEAASVETFGEVEALLSRVKLPIAGLPDQFPTAYVVATDALAPS